MLTVEEIKKAIENTNYEVYGIRADKIKYNVGDIAENSHQLYMDPMYDDNDELVYPEREDGFYDAGELDGTCAIEIKDPEDEESIKRALNTVVEGYAYDGADYIHLIGSDYYYAGNDIGEVVIADAKVVANI